MVWRTKGKIRRFLFYVEGLVFCLKIYLWEGRTWGSRVTSLWQMWFARLERVVPLEKVPSRQLCQPSLCVANEMRVLQLHVQVRCSFTICHTSSYHTELYLPFTTSTNRMNWKADLTTFNLRTSWSTQKHTHHDFHNLNKWRVLDNPHWLVAIC